MIHTMDILDPTGHLSLSWDTKDGEAIAKARAEFERLKAAGYTFYAVPVEHTTFDESAGEMTVEAPFERPPQGPRAGEGEPAKRKPRGRRKQAEGPVTDFEPKSERTVAVPRMRGG